MATSFETWRRADEEWTDEDKDLIWRVYQCDGAVNGRTGQVSNQGT